MSHVESVTVGVGPTYTHNSSSASSGAVAIQDEGVEDVAEATAINFVGDGVSVADAGSGVATVTIPGQAQAKYAQVLTSETTTSTSYTDLATAGPSVEFTVPASGEVRVVITGYLQNSAAGNYHFMGVALSGGNTLAADDARSLATKSAGTNSAMQSSRTLVLTGLTPGATTFTAKYRTTAGTATFSDRSILVEPLDLA